MTPGRSLDKMNDTWCADDLSELEEFIDNCCRMSLERGYRLRIECEHYEDVTPVEAAAVADGLCPSAVGGRLVLRMSRREAEAFMAGFLHDGEFFEMGRRFRERVLAGEYDP